ncbi:MAG: hypothetical protein WKF93_12400 [Acidimicrobiales bacterium]
MIEPRIITADDLCRAAENILRTNLHPLVEALALEDFEEITDWAQVPTMEAVAHADTPTGAISSPGLVDAPVRKAHGVYDATWRVVVSVFDRDEDYNATAARTRQWAALVRALLIDNPSLGGVASSLTWVGEDYAERPRKDEARTFGGCAVAFDVTAKNVAELGSGDPQFPSTNTPVSTTITQRP